MKVDKEYILDVVAVCGIGVGACLLLAAVVGFMGMIVYAFFAAMGWAGGTLAIIVLLWLGWSFNRLPEHL